MAEVLVLGGGGREVAIGQAMEASPEVTRVEIASDVNDGLARFKGGDKPFVVVGPEAPLIAGVTDHLRIEGHSVFGPTKQMAEYERRKSHAIRMMREAKIPHPPTFIADTDNAALEFVKFHDAKDYVIKADLPFGGKGVVITDSNEQALSITLDMRTGGGYGGAGTDIINYQRRHQGPEVSDIVIVGANDQIFRLPMTQDHKRLLACDKGPNTGGMGAYGPVPESIVNNYQFSKIEELAEKSLWGMRKAGVPYEQAALYSGLMLAEQLEGDPEVIEYNVRFGDPETQVQFPLAVKAGVDMYRLLRSAAERDLEVPRIDFHALGLSALTVCLAAKGYPDSPIKGDYIWGLDAELPDGVSVQKAAVTADEATNGGRVAYVTAVAEDIDSAAELAYGIIDLKGEGPDSGKIGWAGMQARNDIGWQARRVA